VMAPAHLRRLGVCQYRIRMVLQSFVPVVARYVTDAAAVLVALDKVCDKGAVNIGDAEDPN
jgi:hypothetical protein